MTPQLPPVGSVSDLSSLSSAIDNAGAHKTALSKTAEGPSVRFGVTDPINLKLPTPRDRFLTQKLENMMRSKKLYETEEGQKRREFVLEELRKLLCVSEQRWDMNVDRFLVPIDLFFRNGYPR